MRIASVTGCEGMGPTATCFHADILGLIEGVALKQDRLQILVGASAIDRISAVKVRLL